MVELCVLLSLSTILFNLEYINLPSQPTKGNVKRSQNTFIFLVFTIDIKLIVAKCHYPIKGTIGSG